MVRGIYTGASAMAARVNQMSIIANNLSNVNTTAYKKDVAIFKAFPEMKISRIDDNIFRQSSPPGSIDKRPVIGTLGTGVELNEVYNQKSLGSLRSTENKFDLAIAGEGYFTIETPQGIRYTRNGSFTLDKNQQLVTHQGYPVLGNNVENNGYLYFNEEDVEINADGRIYSQEFSDTLRIVNFEKPRYLEKQANTLFVATPESGEAFLEDWSNFKIEVGFLETSNVKIVDEMVKMIEVQRAYEASQKTITSHDRLLDKLINEMTKV